MKESLWDKHKNCEVVIDFNYTTRKGQQAMNPALVCKCHGKWIKWMSYEEANEFAKLMPKENLLNAPDVIYDPMWSLEQEAREYTSRQQEPTPPDSYAVYPKS